VAELAGLERPTSWETRNAADARSPRDRRVPATQPRRRRHAGSSRPRSPRPRLDLVGALVDGHHRGLEEVAQHLLGDLEVGYHAILSGGRIRTCARARTVQRCPASGSLPRGRRPHRRGPGGCRPCRRVACSAFGVGSDPQWLSGSVRASAVQARWGRRPERRPPHPVSPGARVIRSGPAPHVWGNRTGVRRIHGCSAPVDRSGSTHDHDRV